MTIAALISDMAGTTVEDGGAVLGAFDEALDVLGLETGEERREAVDYVIATMGRSKIDVFTDLFGSARAIEANEAFEEAYAKKVGSGVIRPIEGTEALFGALEAAGVAVALTTGFSPATRTALLAALGWTERIAVAVSPSDAGRGRPAPDMILLAASRLGIDDLGQVAVAGDTASDMEAGSASGAGLVVGVLTGTDTAERLWSAGATHVLDSIVEIEGLLIP